MVAEHSHSEYVSGKQVLLWAGTAIASVVVLGWTLHSQQVSKNVYETNLKHQAEWRDEQRRDMSEIKTAVKELRYEIIKRVQ